MNILFRCDSSQEIGLGHLNRCLILAKKLKGEIYFASRDLKGSENEKIEKEGFKRVPLKSNDFKEFKEAVLKYKIDTVIFDHYEIDEEFEKKTKELGVKTISFDDTYEKHLSDIVINPNFGAKNRYEGNKVLFLAPLVREEFFKPQKKYAKKVKNVLISLGGSDPKNLTLKILRILKRKKYKISVATTSSNKNLKKLKSLKREIKLYIDFPDMRRLFSKNDILILSSSTVSTEALVSKTPFITIKTAKNQKEPFEFFKRKRFPAFDKLSHIKINSEIYKNSIKRVKSFKYKTWTDSKII